MTKTIVALYDDMTAAQDAVKDLISAGISRDSISLVANDVSGNYSEYANRDLTVTSESDDVSAGEGAGFGAVIGTLLGLGAALIPGVGPIVAAGPLAAVIMAGIGAAAGAITGGVVAGLVDLGIPEEEANIYAEGIRRGGTMLSVTVNDEYANRVEDIMNRHAPVDLEHRTDAWRERGWETFDRDSTAYSRSEIDRERDLLGTPSGSMLDSDLDDTTTDLYDRQDYQSLGGSSTSTGGNRARSYPSRNE
jgi:hypothetical protein